MINVYCYHIGKLKTNCYVVVDTISHDALIIDPAGQNNELNEFIESFGKDNFKYILLTHGHFDHITGVPMYKNLTGAKICISEKEKDFLINSELNLSYKFGRKKIEPFFADILINDNELLKFGETQIKAVSTPGHTKGSMCFVLNNLVFSGDTLFKESAGRTDLPTGSSEDLGESLKKLLIFNGDCIVYPGHGDSTTIDYEKKNNPYYTGKEV